MTIGELKKKLLEKGGKLENPFLEIRILLSYLGIDEKAQIVHRDEEVDEATAREAVRLYEKRISGTPMAYITRTKEFYGHTFHVDESVLIPRPDTEILVEKAVEEYRKRGYRGKILDLCCGSGAIAASIACELSKDVFFSDISESALATAERNYREITGLAPHSRKGDLLEPWKGEEFSLIATNPPYLTRKWYEETEESVRKEPVNAFLGYGDDGLCIIKKIVLASPQVLEKNGTLLIECDYRQAKAVSVLLEENGFTGVKRERDLRGLERVVYGEYEG